MKILIIGSLNAELIAAIQIVKSKGCSVSHVQDAHVALNTLRNGACFELLIVDINENISNLVEMLTKEKIAFKLISCGVDASPEEAANSIRAGAADYLPLPPNEVLIAAILEKIAGESFSSTNVIGSSNAWNEVLRLIDKIAATEATVLITGESGTGKEVVAKLVHQKSKHSTHEMVALNCAAIPENLLESELFGHEKGAFTGAAARRIGKFEAANNSTLFLDEVSEMDEKLQAKLLRAIQEKEITRVGANTVVKVSARLIAATNTNLLDRVKEGSFREDLYYRLNVINIHLPPLRERLEDIPALATYFIKKYAKLNDMEEKKFTDAALNKMQSYYWPGNVRELENIVHRALLISDDEIGESDIAIDTKLSLALDPGERKEIESAINACMGDEVKAAMTLGISIKSLRSKLEAIKKVA